MLVHKKVQRTIEDRRCLFMYSSARPKELNISRPTSDQVREVLKFDNHTRVRSGLEGDRSWSEQGFVDDETDLKR